MAYAKSWLTGKDSDAGKDWEQEDKGMTEDEMAGWHHWLDGCESEWTLGVGDAQGGLGRWDSWGRKESDMTERLNWTSVGYNVYNHLTLLIMNHGFNLVVSPFNTFQVRFKEFGDVGLSSAFKVYKVFTKVGQGPWLKRKLYLEPTSVINCSEFVFWSIWL